MRESFLIEAGVTRLRTRDDKKPYSKALGVRTERSGRTSEGEMPMKKPTVTTAAHPHTLRPGAARL